MFRSLALVCAVGSLAFSAPALAQGSAGWQHYQDANYGFSAELPRNFRQVDSDGTPGIALGEVGGEATIKLYGGPADGMTRDILEARLEAGTPNSTVTYRAGGPSWFTLSGFYKGNTGDDTIYYTKVLFSTDRQTFSAFEITFPSSQKPHFEQMVEYFEDHFTRPTSN